MVINGWRKAVGNRCGFGSGGWVICPRGKLQASVYDILLPGAGRLPESKDWYARSVPESKAWYAGRVQESKDWYARSVPESKNWYARRVQESKDWYAGRVQESKDWYAGRVPESKDWYVTLTMNPDLHLMARFQTGQSIS